MSAAMARARSWIVPATAVIVVSLVASSCGVSRAVVRPTSGPHPTGSPVQVFLARYVQPDGRVVRIDQGGDTVSEGQAYAMLLAVAADDRGLFLHIWSWSETNLGQSDGLLASSWDGTVVDPHSASDADLDVARALLLAGAKWHDARLSQAGRTYGAAILANETVVVQGRTVLVAGPWARTAPYWVDPSYFDPVTYALLAERTGDAQWRSVERSSEAILDSITDEGRQLPANWAQVSADGAATPSGPPGGGTPRYGYDAFRVLIRQAQACSGPDGRTLVAELAPLVRRTASAGDRADTYWLDGTVATPGDNPLTLMAAAAASSDPVRHDDLIEARDAATRRPSYFLDAWAALGQVLLTTSELGGCAA